MYIYIYVNIPWIMMIYQSNTCSACHHIIFNYKAMRCVYIYFFTTTMQPYVACAAQTKHR